MLIVGFFVILDFMEKKPRNFDKDLSPDIDIDVCAQLNREEFKKLEEAEIKKIYKACPNYQDSDSPDALSANSRLAYFYSRIIDKLLKENEELRQTVELKNKLDGLFK